MRLDKFVGKALYLLGLIVYDWPTNAELFRIPDGEYFSEYKKEMKNYKVHCYGVRSENTLVVYAKKKED